MNFTTPLDQAWLRYWIGVFGPDSSLRRFLRDDIPPPPLPRPEPAEPPLNRRERRMRDATLRRLKRVRPSQPAPPPPRPIVDHPPPPRPAVDHSSRPARPRPDRPAVEPISIDDFLEGLDDYFYWLKRFKYWRPEMFDMYAEVGGIVVPPDFMRRGPSSERSHMLLGHPEHWPGFMCVSYSRRLDDRHHYDEKKEIAPKLLVWWKCKTSLFFVAPLGYTFYQGVIFYVHRGQKFRWPLEVMIGVSERGDILPLRGLCAKMQTLPQARNRTNAGEITTITHRDYDYPPPLTFFVKDWNRRHPEEEPLTVYTFLEETFLATLGETLAAERGVQVTARNAAGITGRFGIPLANTSQFFRDRDRASDERRRAIYHGVSAYSYTRADGREVHVGEHRRGLAERRFHWHEHDIIVTEPGRHHLPFSRYEGSMIDEDEAAKGEKTWSTKQMAKWFADWVDHSPDRGQVNLEESYRRVFRKEAVE